jgi:hypothetical protein
MGKLIYSMSLSLDGFVETPSRPFGSRVFYLRYETVRR